MYQLDCKYSTLSPIIKGVIALGSIIYTDNFTSYQHLLLDGYKDHFTVNHGDNEFAKDGQIHTNGIENLWALSKRRLSKFRGIDKLTFTAHIKEYEFRYNHRHDNIYNILLYNFRHKPLKLS